MKKKFTYIILAVCAAALAIFSAGCGASKKVEQFFCDHEYTEKSVKKEATCTEKGEAVMECVFCGKEKTANIQTIAHNYDEGTVKKAATCTVAGEIVYECLDCSTKKVVAVVAKGHEYNEYKCIACGIAKPATEGLTYGVNESYELGVDGYFCTGLGTATDTDIVIAAEYNGKPVIGIDSHAFFESNITSVVIPESVLCIVDISFSECSALKCVVFLGETENSGGDTFYGSSVETVIVPDGKAEYYSNQYRLYFGDATIIELSNYEASQGTGSEVVAVSAFGLDSVEEVKNGETSVDETSHSLLDEWQKMEAYELTDCDDSK